MTGPVTSLRPASCGGVDNYAAFLAAKTLIPRPRGIEAEAMGAHLADFQQYAVRHCLKQGRAACFFDTGLGKSRIAMEFSRQAAKVTNGYALILTPLAVAREMQREGKLLGYDIGVVREAADVRPGISVCNYDRLDTLDANMFGSVTLDESSLLKSFTGKTTRALIDTFRDTPFRLCCTATPAPNDHMELGQHAEFLGIMPSNEMLMRWFTADQTQMGRYRLKGHGVNAFWDWMAAWAVMASNPADLGFDGSRYNLPTLNVVRHRAAGDSRAPAGELFMSDVSATNMFAVKRDTEQARAALAVEQVADRPGEPWVIWVDTDSEADAIHRLLPGVIEVRGSHTADRKGSAIADFIAGRALYLLTKPSICGWGLNFQHCANTVFVGRSFSYEAWYQAVRRFWRFGQSRPVNVHLVVGEGEDQIGRVIDRKADDHASMKTAMAKAMKRVRGDASVNRVAYQPTFSAEMPSWLKSVA